MRRREYTRLAAESFPLGPARLGELPRLGAVQPEAAFAPASGAIHRRASPSGEPWRSLAGRGVDRTGLLDLLAGVAR